MSAPHGRQHVSRRASPATRICCTGAALMIVLLPLRARIVHGLTDHHPAGDFLGRLAAASYGDVAYSAGLTCIFLLLCLLAASRPGVQHLVAGFFELAAGVSLAFGFVNVRAIAELGQPLNYQWLYYSHFMQSMDTYTALADLVSWRSLSLVTLGCVALLFLSRLLTFGSVYVGARIGQRRPSAIAATILVAYLVVARTWSVRLGLPPADVQNPAIALLDSYRRADDEPVLAEMATAIGADDFLTRGQRSPTASRTAYTARAQRDQVRNVVVMVLESVGAGYVAGFGDADSALTPELWTYGRSGLRFTSFYAHQPSTSSSLLALLLSVYPPHSFRAITREHPDIGLPSLSGELQRQGYRTAMFNAEDNRFQGANVFLSQRRFDLVEDAPSSSCRVAVDSHADQCMVNNLVKWIDHGPRRPFFALLWTAQTHYPYLSPRTEVGQTIAPAVAPSQHPDSLLDTRYTRYLRALHESDRAIGSVFRQLDQRHLLDSTLIVVLGDHGEAFGQHGNMFHRLLYEEEVRIPLLLVNRRLFPAALDSTVGGTIDIAPTVLDLLGYPAPREWQGHSLFERARSGRVYLFGPYSGLFGLREATRKVIYNPIAGQFEVYDLASDPLETVNLAASNEDLVQLAQQRLAAWVQYQDRFYRAHGVPR